MRSFLFLLTTTLFLGGSHGFVFDGIRKSLKAEILQLSRETKRGIQATPEQEQRISDIFTKLEKLNPTRNPLKSPLINADWSLEYSTAGYIIGKGGFPRVGPIVQKIDTDSLQAENSEVVSYFGVKVPRKVSAELLPQSNRLTNVQFKQFSVGPISFEAPEQFKGFLDITYLDGDLRLTRGDKENLFVLTRM